MKQTLHVHRPGCVARARPVRRLQHRSAARGCAVGARRPDREQALHALARARGTSLANLQEPITLRFFFSKKLAPTQAPACVTLRRSACRSCSRSTPRTRGGKLKLEVIDPEPFTEEEDQAVALRPAGRARSTRPARCSTSASRARTRPTRRRRSPSSRRAREEFARVRRDAARLQPGEPQEEGRRAPDRRCRWTATRWRGCRTRTRRRSRGSCSKRCASSSRCARSRPTTEKIETDIDVLMVVHPQGLSPQTLYAIDQFVLRGGKAAGLRRSLLRGAGSAAGSERTRWRR